MFLNAQYMDEAKTIICATRADGTTRVIDGSDQDLWLLATSGTVAPFVPPPEPTEAEKLEAERAVMWCWPLQGKLALGETEWGKVETILAAPETPFSMRIAITSAAQWLRNSQMIDELAWVMGYTAEQVDDLFRTAALIEV